MNVLLTFQQPHRLMPCDRGHNLGLSVQHGREPLRLSLEEILTRDISLPERFRGTDRAHQAPDLVALLAITGGIVVDVGGLPVVFVVKPFARTRDQSLRQWTQALPPARSTASLRQSKTTLFTHRRWIIKQVREGETQRLNDLRSTRITPVAHQCDLAAPFPTTRGIGDVQRWSRLIVDRAQREEVIPAPLRLTSSLLQSRIHPVQGRSWTP